MPTGSPKDSKKTGKTTNPNRGRSEVRDSVITEFDERPQSKTPSGHRLSVTPPRGARDSNITEFDDRPQSKTPSGRPLSDDTPHTGNLRNNSPPGNRGSGTTIASSAQSTSSGPDAITGQFVEMSLADGGRAQPTKTSRDSGESASASGSRPPTREGKSRSQTPQGRTSSKESSPKTKEEKEVKENLKKLEGTTNMNLVVQAGKKTSANREDAQKKKKDEASKELVDNAGRVVSDRRRKAKEEKEAKKEDKNQ